MKNTLLEQAEQHHRAGEFNQALEKYQAALAENPRQPHTLHAIAVLLGQCMQFESALEQINQAIKQSPQEASFYNTKGNILRRLNQFKKALSAYKTAIKIKINYAAAHNNLGNAYADQEQYKQAKTHYQQAIQCEPLFAAAHFNLGRLLAKEGAWEEANTALKEAIKINPHYAAALNQLGQLSLQNGKTALAIDYFKQCLAVHPQHTIAQHDLGLAYLAEKAYQKAATAFEKTIDLEPKHPEAHYHLGIAYLEMGDHKNALAAYSRQIEQHPTPDAYYNIGVLMMHNERHKESLSYFQKVLETTPGHLETHLNLAAVYLKMNRTDDATRQYQTALKLKPNDPEIQHILSALLQEDTPQKAPSEYIQHLFDQYAPHYEQHLKEHLHYQVPELIHKMLKEECDLTHPEWLIVDLGCGTGLCAKLLGPFAKKLVGIDLSPSMIAQAKDQGRYDALETEDIVSGLAHYTDVDLITAADVFTYLGDLSPIFTQASKSLKSGGHFIFSVEKGHSAPYQLQQTVRYAHTKTYIEELIQAHGFKTLRCDNAVLRQQFKQPIEGYLCLLTKM